MRGYFVTVRVTVAVRNNDPLVPVMRSVNVPKVGCLLTANVSVETPAPPLMADVVNVAVTPAGSPEMLRRTGSTNPFNEVIVTVMFAEPLLGMASEAGAAEMAKSVTCIFTVVECRVGPLAAITLREKSPAATPPLVITVSEIGVVILGFRFTMGDDRTTLIPVGMPETLRPTSPLKPFREARKMFVVEDPLTGTAISGVPGVIEKSVITSSTPVAVKVRPLIPITNITTVPADALGLAVTVRVDDPNWLLGPRTIEVEESWAVRSLGTLRLDS